MYGKLDEGGDTPFSGGLPVGEARQGIESKEKLRCEHGNYKGECLICHREENDPPEDRD